MAVQRTLSIIKPDATRRNLTGAINNKIENIDMVDIGVESGLFFHRG